jgi:hypothetical protein
MPGSTGAFESNGPAFRKKVGDCVRVVRIRPRLQKVACRLTADPLGDDVADAAGAAVPLVDTQRYGSIP